MATISMDETTARYKAIRINECMAKHNLPYRFEPYDISDNEDTSTWGEFIIALEI